MSEPGWNPSERIGRSLFCSPIIYPFFVWLMRKKQIIIESIAEMFWNWVTIKETKSFDSKLMESIINCLKKVWLIVCLIWFTSYCYFTEWKQIQNWITIELLENRWFRRLLRDDYLKISLFVRQLSELSVLEESIERLFISLLELNQFMNETIIFSFSASVLSLCSQSLIKWFYEKTNANTNLLPFFESRSKCSKFVSFIRLLSLLTLSTS